MTLKATIEEEFAHLLQKQTKEEFPLDLTLDGPVFTVIHPKIIWASLQFENNTIGEAPTGEIFGWNFEAFKDVTIAEKKYPEIQLKFIGRPWSFHQFLKSGAESAIVDFPGIGVAVLSKKTLPIQAGNELHHHLVPIWLSYALSPELWGPVGKWPRFHERLLKLLKDHDLLAGPAELGYYPLKLPAEKLKSHGLMGTSLDKTYLLVLPWTFSLSALNRVEEIVRQEF